MKMNFLKLKVISVLMLMVFSLACDESPEEQGHKLEGDPYLEESEEGEIRGVYFEHGSKQAAECAEIYDPVCGQPPMPKCPEGMACAQVMPELKTYSNECEMEAEGATLVSRGECSSSY